MITVYCKIHKLHHIHLAIAKKTVEFTQKSKLIKQRSSVQLWINKKQLIKYTVNVYILKFNAKTQFIHELKLNENSKAPN